MDRSSILPDKISLKFPPTIPPGTELLLRGSLLGMAVPLAGASPVLHREQTSPL